MRPYLKFLPRNACRPGDEECSVSTKAALRDPAGEVSRNLCPCRMRVSPSNAHVLKIALKSLCDIHKGLLDDFSGDLSGDFCKYRR